MTTILSTWQPDLTVRASPASLASLFPHNHINMTLYVKKKLSYEHVNQSKPQYYVK